MDRRKNAPCSPRGRELAVRRVLEEGWAVSETAHAAGVSRQAVYYWIAAWMREGAAGLQGHSSAPTRSPRRTAEPLIQEIRRLREQERLAGEDIASRLGLPRSTVGRWLRRYGLGRLPRLAPPEPIRRYQKEHAGELLHLDTKKLGRIDGIGHRIHGDRRTRNRGIGWDIVFVAVDDASRWSYCEVLGDECGTTAAAFLERAVAAFARLGISVQRVLTDNGSCFVSRSFTQLCLRLGIRHSRTRPYRPRTNGKAERFIQTLLREWAYAVPFVTSAIRTRTLDLYLHLYNHHRAHSALNRLSPMAWLSVNNVVSNNT